MRNLWSWREDDVAMALDAHRDGSFELTAFCGTRARVDWRRAQPVRRARASQ